MWETKGKVGSGSNEMSDAYNFTSLEADTIVFNVSNFGTGNVSVGKFIIN